MDKIFHVFVSSTYIDLIDERKKVSEAVAKAGYVAEGMEIFPASSQKQMDFIMNVIDRCDYYILIVAGCYGSVSKNGKSYTENEFIYAKSKCIPVLVFIKNDIDKIPLNKTDDASDKQKKLENFIDVLKNDSMVDFWSSSDELSTKALAALAQASASHKGVGWIRADNAASIEVLRENNELRKDNSELRKDNSELSTKLASFKPDPIYDGIKLADLDEKFKFTIKSTFTTETVSLTWHAILVAIGPDYRAAHNTSRMDSGLIKALQSMSPNKLDSLLEEPFTVDKENKKQMLIQLEAIGMMHAVNCKLEKGRTSVRYKLTEKRLEYVLKENVVKSFKNA